MNATLPPTSSLPACTVVRPAAADAYWLVSELMEPQLVGEMDVVHVIAAPNGGPPPHLHRLEDEMFYVIDGEFEFVFDDTRFIGGPGTAAFLPKNAVHTYNNIAPRDGRLLVVANPGGFERFIATTGDICLDRSKPPKIGPATFEKLAAGCARAKIELLPAHKADKPAVARPKSREFWVLGAHIRQLLTSVDTNGQFSVAEITAPPGFFVPPHAHRVEDEFFYVLEGEFEFDLPEGVIVAEPGTFVHVPRKVVHAFRNAAESPARLLDVHTPGGFEKFFRAAGSPCADIKLGPPGAQPDMARFAALCREHGMEM